MRMATFLDMGIVLLFCLAGMARSHQHNTELDSYIENEMTLLEATIKAQQDNIQQLKDTYDGQYSKIVSLTRELEKIKEKEAPEASQTLDHQQQEKNPKEADAITEHQNSHEHGNVTGHKRFFDVNEWRKTPKQAVASANVQPVAFYAIFERFTSQRVTEGDTIMFNNVHTNLMGAYDASRSMFVAPVSGVYLFSVSIECFTKTLCKAGLTRNGQRVAVAYSDAIDYDDGQGAPLTDQGAVTMALSLDTGDEVWVRAYLETDQLISGERASVFTGILIWAFE